MKRELTHIIALTAILMLASFPCCAGAAQRWLQKYSYVQIHGKKLELNESLPVLEKMLMASNKAEVGEAVSCVHRWSRQLIGRPIVDVIVERYSREKDPMLKLELLKAIGEIADPKTQAFLKMESKSQVELLKMIALAGLIEQGSRPAAVELARLMVETKDRTIAKECLTLLFTSLDENKPLEAFDFESPAKQKMAQFHKWESSGILSKLAETVPEK